MKIAPDSPALFILHLHEVSAQIAERLFFLHSVRDIPSDFRETDQLVGFVPNGCDDYICPECRTVLASSPAFIFESSLLHCSLEFPTGLAGANIALGIEAGKVPADNFRSLISFDPLGPLVPGADVALGIQHEDGIVLNALGH